MSEEERDLQGIVSGVGLRSDFSQQKNQKSRSQRCQKNGLIFVRDKGNKN